MAIDKFARGRNPRFPVGYSKAPTGTPADAMPRYIGPTTFPLGGSAAEGPEGDLANIDKNVDQLSAIQRLSYGFAAQQYVVIDTPILIYDGRYSGAYIFLNPVVSATGLNNTGLVFGPSTQLAGASGDTTLVPIGTAGYNRLALWLDITAAGGGEVLTVNALTQDPISLNWATAQGDIFGGASTVGTYYANLGTLGNDTAFAISWSIAGGVSLTFSVSFMLKEGIAGVTSSGLPNTVYLGTQNVNSSVGYPLLEGKELVKYMSPNTPLYAISLNPGGVVVSVFQQ